MNHLKELLDTLELDALKCQACGMQEVSTDAVAVLFKSADHNSRSWEVLVCKEHCIIDRYTNSSTPVVQPRHVVAGRKLKESQKEKSK